MQKRENGFYSEMDKPVFGLFAYQTLFSENAVGDCRHICLEVIFKRVRLYPFVIVCHLGVVSERLSASTDPASHLLSQDPLILSAPPLSLHAFYLSPTLSPGGGKDTLMCLESMTEKYGIITEEGRRVKAY